MAIIAQYFRESNYLNTSWTAVVAANTKKDDLFDPKFWVNIAPQVKRFDKIEVIHENGEFWGLFLVVDCARQWVKIKQIEFMNLNKEPDAPAVQEEFIIKYANPHARYRVIRKGDNAVLQERLQTEQDAEAWLANYKRSIAA